VLTCSHERATHAQVLTVSEREQNFNNLREATRFFMGEGNVHMAAQRIAEVLDAMGIPYALAGGVAVDVHGYHRVTTDVDVLLSGRDLLRFKERWVGRGWMDRYPGSKNMRDTIAGVNIDVLLVGDYPGDGKPKPVRFPQPRRAAAPVGALQVLGLRTLIQLKLASGMSAPDRLKDLDDVIQLVRVNKLPREFAGRLNPWVRAKYIEMWTVAQRPAEGQSPTWARMQRRRRP
jgi:hypothetical protein